MVFIKSMKNLLSKFSRDLGRDLYHIIVKIIGYMIVFLIIGFCATRCTKAMTINDNLRTINESQLSLFQNISSRLNYKYYVATLDYTSSGYNNYYTYYLCLTNSDLDISNPVNLSTSCDELYRYYSTSSNYSFEKLNDNKLIINNSNYYTNYNDFKHMITGILFSIALGIFIGILTFVICLLFRR